MSRPPLTPGRVSPLLPDLPDLISSPRAATTLGSFSGLTTHRKATARSFLLPLQKKQNLLGNSSPKKSAQQSSWKDHSNGTFPRRLLTSKVLTWCPRRTSPALCTTSHWDILSYRGQTRRTFHILFCNNECICLTLKKKTAIFTLHSVNLCFDLEF